MRDHAREKALNIRIALLEDGIRTHRMYVRDGWRDRWRPDFEPNAYLWRLIDE